MPANYVLLERVELNASAASVTFANIPQTGYTDLKVVMSLRISDTQLNYGVMRINGATTNFTYRSLEGSGSAANSYNGSVSNYGIPEISSYTANTFSSHEVYIPNYLSSSNKSFSVDAVTENNATASYADFVAGLWSNTAAINELSFYAPTGSFVQYSTFSLYGIAAVGTTPAIYPKATGGNIITNDGTYWYHAFLSSGIFTPSSNLSCDYLVIAGGGGSTSDQGGGGGAGGLRSTVGATGGGGTLETAATMTSSTNYTITVGGGGAGVNIYTVAPSGTNSSIVGTGVSITSTGGGGGGGQSSGAAANGANGGSGGGASTYASARATGTANQGYDGGWGGVANARGSGGGGAGQQGGDSNGTVAGNGGNGISISTWASATSTGVSNYYAGGGGGGGFLSQGRGSGGLGGGGNGGNNGGGAGFSGTTNTGSGGGGATQSGPTWFGGNGGSGIIIVRYTMA
jgi:hypothetical protein